MPNQRNLGTGGKFNPKKVKGLALWLDGSDTSRMYTSDAGAVVIPPGWSPFSISLNIAGWWAADSYPAGLIQFDGFGNVMGVDDLSGMYSDATQTTPAARPQLIPNVLNGKPVFRFNGSTGLTGTFGSVPLDTERTVFAVCKISAGLTNQRVFSVSSTNGTADYATGQSIPVLANAGSLTQLSSYGSLASRSPVGDFSQFAVFTNTATGGSITNYSNGLAGATESVTTNLDGYYFGIGCAAHDQTAKFTGDIAEIIAVEGVCPPDERAMVEKWLADKWGISGVHRSAAQEIAAVASPTEIGGCVGWWDAGDPATITRDNATLLVSQWNDKSGFGRNLTQSDAARRPIYGGGSIVWPSVENGRQLDYPTAFAHQTVIVVCQYGSGQGTGFGGAQGLISSSSALGLLISGTTWYGAHPFATSFNNVRINGAAAIRVDGQTALPMPLRILTCTRDTAATQGLIIGGERFYTNRGWSGPICEVIAFDRALTTTDALRVENYLQTKWGTPAVPEPTPSIGAWLDKSGNNRHAVQATTANRPAISATTQGGKKALAFDVTTKNLVSPTAVNQYVADATTSPKMFFAFVARPEGGSALISYGSPTNPNSSSRVFYCSDFGSAGSHIVDFGGISSDGVGGARLTGVVGNEADNVGHVYSAFRDGVIMSVRRDGVEILRKADCTGVYSDTTGTLGINAAQGGSGTASWCEFMAYAASMPSGNIRRIETYLAKRWGIELAPQVTHPEAQDWINRVYQNGGVVSPSTAAAVNQFCQSITSAGIRDRFIRLNLFCGSFQGAFVPLYRTPHAIVTNQFHYGTDMTNAVWKSGGNGAITRTATTEAGPQGYGFATKLTTPVATFATRQMYQQVPPTGQQVTVSAWMKTNTGTKQIQWLAGNVYSDTVTVTSTWQLFSKTFTLPTSGDSRTGLSTVDELNSAGHIFVYEMQCENGAGVDDYTQPVYGNATDTNVGPFLTTDYSESNGLQAMTAAQAAGATAATKHLNCGMVFHALPYHASSHIAADIKLHPGATYAAQMVIMQAFADSIDDQIYFSQHRLSLTTARALEYNSGGGSPISRPNLSEGPRHFVLSSRLDINQHAAYLNGGSALSGSTISGTRLVRTTAEIAPFANWNGGAAPTYRHIMAAYSFGTGLAPSEAVAYSNAMAAFKFAMGRYDPL